MRPCRRDDLGDITMSVGGILRGALKRVVRQVESYLCAHCSKL